MTNNIAINLLNMSVFEKENHCSFRVPCFICIFITNLCVWKNMYVLF